MRLKVRVNAQTLGPRCYGHGLTWRRGPLIGKGGFGSVYLGILKPSGFCQSRNFSYPSYMAVKSAEISQSSSLREEKEVLASLVGCPNVIRYLGEETTVGCGGSLAYNLLLEYGSGGSLYDRIYKSGLNGLPESEVRWYTKSILEGLMYIHEAGYVHCDLKPENILLVPRTRKGRTEIMAKICDFGLAKRASGNQRRRKLERSSWRGTPMYLSPEAVKNGVQECPCDIWALGCIVLEMLTRKRPWNLEAGGDEKTILERIGKSVAVPKIPKELSSEARRFLRCCLKRMVGNRLSAKSLLQHPFVKGLTNDGDDEGQDQGFEEDEEMDDMENWSPKHEQHSASHCVPEDYAREKVLQFEATSRTQQIAWSRFPLKHIV